MDSFEMLEFKNVEEIYQKVTNSIVLGDFKTKNINVSFFYTDVILPKGLTKVGVHQYRPDILAPFIEFDEKVSEVLYEKNLYEEGDLEDLKLNIVSGEVRSKDEVLGTFMILQADPRISAFRIYSIDGAKYADDLLKLVRMKRLGI